jgi:hypothetical protein
VTSADRIGAVPVVANGANMTGITDVLDRMLDPLQQSMTHDMAERVLKLRMDDASQQRFDDLAARHHEGLLSAEEFSEYQAIVQGVSLISVMQAKARKHLLTPAA